MENTLQNNKLTFAKMFALGFQHVFAMFGATVLVPIITGLNSSVALFTAGVGTLMFHLITRRKVPVFLGSSFAFIGAIKAIVDSQGIAYAGGGIIIAGLLYLMLAGLVLVFGVEKIKNFFPPLVTGPIIMVIGLHLSRTIAENYIISDSLPGTLVQRWIVVLAVVATMIIVSVFFKGFFKMVPVLLGIIVGYIVAVMFNFVDFSIMKEAAFIQLPPFTAPKFSLEAITLIAPIAIVTFMEHIGDITTIGAVTGNNFIKDPGLHRTLMGDGLATAFAGLLGGPANTTYSENTGVIAVTKVFNPVVVEIAAVIAILMSLVGKLGALIQSIPLPVMGGVCLLLFGIIASVGIRTLADAEIDFSHSRNLIIISLMLVMGLSGVEFPITAQASLSGMSLAALVGILLNKILPSDLDKNTEESK